MMIEITEEQVYNIWKEGKETYATASSYWDSMKMLGFVDCDNCRGTGWQKPNATDVAIYKHQICHVCLGRGWVHNAK